MAQDSVPIVEGILSVNDAAIPGGQRYRGTGAPRSGSFPTYDYGKGVRSSIGDWTTRDGPVAMDVMDAVVNAVNAVDPAIEISFTSGSQDRRGQGNQRTGSTRHDHLADADEGLAIDFTLSKDGQRIDQGSKLGLAIAESIAAHGITGFGHYGSGVYHADKVPGRQATWGPSTSSATLDPEIGAAIERGRALTPGDILARKEDNLVPGILSAGDFTTGPSPEELAMSQQMAAIQEGMFAQPSVPSVSMEPDPGLLAAVERQASATATQQAIAEAVAPTAPESYGVLGAGAVPAEAVAPSTPAAPASYGVLGAGTVSAPAEVAAVAPAEMATTSPVEVASPAPVEMAAPVAVETAAPVEVETATAAPAPTGGILSDYSAPATTTAAPDMRVDGALHAAAVEAQRAAAPTASPAPAAGLFSDTPMASQPVEMTAPDYSNMAELLSVEAAPAQVTPDMAVDPGLYAAAKQKELEITRALQDTPPTPVEAPAPTVAAPPTVEAPTAPTQPAPERVAPAPSIAIAQAPAPTPTPAPPAQAPAPQQVAPAPSPAPQAPAPQAPAPAPSQPSFAQQQQSLFSDRTISPQVVDGFLSGIAPSVVADVNARREAGMTVEAPNGARLGYSPMGGVANVYGSAPEHVSIAATGPGLFGAMDRDFGGNIGSRMERALSGAALGLTGRTAGMAAGGVLGGMVGGPMGAAVGGAIGGRLGGYGTNAFADRAAIGSGYATQAQLGPAISYNGGLFGGLFGGGSPASGDGMGGGSIGGSGTSDYSGGNANLDSGSLSDPFR